MITVDRNLGNFPAGFVSDRWRRGLLHGVFDRDDINALHRPAPGIQVSMTAYFKNSHGFISYANDSEIRGLQLDAIWFEDTVAGRVACPSTGSS
jgi:hypothetical protein